MYTIKANKMANLSCKLILENKAPFTVLYLYGPRGCGKTALLNYLESEMFKRDPSKTICRISANELNNKDWSERNEFIKAAANSHLFMMDDFNYLCKNNIVLSDIYHMVDHMNLTGGKFVFTGDRHIEDYPTSYSNEFYDRIRWEMVARLSPPKYEDCINALTEFAEELDLCDVPELDKIFESIVKAEECNLGRVLGTFRRIVVRAQMNNEAISNEYANRIIYDDAGIELIEA